MKKKRFWGIFTAAGRKRMAALFTALLFLILQASPGLPALASDFAGYTYTVRFYAGAQGSFDGQSVLTFDNLHYGDRVTFRNSMVTLNNESKYYVMGIRESGKDNNTISTTSFVVTGDLDYVVAYGIRGNLVSYSVNYVDESGNTLQESQIFYGNVGDKPVVAYMYIEGYQPQAYNLGKTLSENASDNQFTFIYKKIAPETTAPPETTPAPTTAPPETTAPAGPTETAAPIETSAVPAESTAPGAEETSPAETTAPGAETSPAETTAPGTETTAPAETTAPGETTAPAETTAQGGETTAPAETTAQSRETTAPAETTAQSRETTASGENGTTAEEEALTSAEGEGGNTSQTTAQAEQSSETNETRESASGPDAFTEPAVEEAASTAGDAPTEYIDLDDTTLPLASYSADETTTATETAETSVAEIISDMAKNLVNVAMPIKIVVIVLVVLILICALMIGRKH